MIIFEPEIYKSNKPSAFYMLKKLVLFAVDHSFTNDNKEPLIKLTGGGAADDFFAISSQRCLLIHQVLPALFVKTDEKPPRGSIRRDLISSSIIVFLLFKDALLSAWRDGRLFKKP